MNAAMAVESAEVVIENVEVRKGFLVLNGKLSWFKAQFEKLARRAARLGVEPPTYTIGEAIFEERVDQDSPEAQAGLPEPQCPKVLIKKWPVIVSGSAPKIAGWTFVASLEHLEGGETIIRNIGAEEAPVTYRTAGPACHHCNLKRDRRDTYLVRSDAGEWKQVGRTCIKDFTGHASPEHIARMAEYLAEAFGLGEGGEMGMMLVEHVAIHEFLTMTSACISDSGWLSRTAARECGKRATADDALWGVFPLGRSADAEEREAQKALRLKAAEEKHQARATVSLDWILANTEESEYIHNCRAIARHGVIERRTAGYAASIIRAYEKAMEIETELKRKALQPSAHVGTVGERIRMTVTIRAIRELTSDWGVSILHMMNDERGNDVKWFSSSAEYEVGQTLEVTAKVKKHEEYKGRKCTLVSRMAPYFEKVKKNKQTKAVAAGIVAAFWAIRADEDIAFGVCCFVAFGEEYPWFGYGGVQF